MVRVSTYKMRKYITSYSSKECVENRIPGKQIPSKSITLKKQISLGDSMILEDKKIK